MNDCSTNKWRIFYHQKKLLDKIIDHSIEKWLLIASIRKNQGLTIRKSRYNIRKERYSGFWKGFG
jgi:hypothetical protein